MWSLSEKPASERASRIGACRCCVPKWLPRNLLRVPRLLEELALARASGVYASLLGNSRASTSWCWMIFFLTDDDVERRDLLEVIEDRYDRTSTVIATQMPTKTWHDALSDPTSPTPSATGSCTTPRAETWWSFNPKKESLEPQPQPLNPVTRRFAPIAFNARNVRSSLAGMSAQVERIRMVERRCTHMHAAVPTKRLVDWGS